MTTCAIHSRIWSALQLSIFLVSSFFEEILFISFQQKNEIKKGNTPMEFKYLLVCSSIDLLDVKDFKRNLTDRNLITKWVLKENLKLQFSWLEESKEWFSGDEHLTSYSTKAAWMINFKLCTYISNRLLHKTGLAFFLMMGY